MYLLTAREQKYYDEIKEWEKEISYDHRSDFNRTYDYWLEKSYQRIPASVRKKILHQLDQLLFYGHSIIQNSNWHVESRNRLISTARLLNDSIDSIPELNTLSVDQIRYLAQMQMSKHRLTSLTQGAVTGTGGMLLLGIDLPAQLIINLRAVQMIAMCYGNEVNTPFEMMMSLKVFHASLLPSQAIYEEWKRLEKELFEHSDEPYFYSGDEHFSTEQTLKHITEQIGKLFLIQLLKRKMIQNIPFLGMVIGARANYQMTKACTNFAQRFYEYRLLCKRKET